MIRALLFDLDGTLWGSEVVRFRSWQRVFEEHGQTYTLDSYAERFGRVGGPDPLDELEAAVGGPIDRDAIGRRREELTERGLAELRPRPGVTEHLDEARRLGLALGVVSTDERGYVLDSLTRLGIADGWDVVATADGDRDRAKPSPALYLEAMATLGVGADETIAVEDSPNGILAATRAQVLCVAVRHELTATMDLGRADLVMDSLEDLTLSELIRRAEARGR